MDKNKKKHDGSFMLSFKSIKIGGRFRRNLWKSANILYVEVNKNKNGFNIKTKGGAIIPWSPTNADLFASDWERYEPVP